MELAKCRTFTNQNEIGGKHCLKNSLMVNSTTAGSHKISDTATTIMIKSVLESRALRSLIFCCVLVSWMLYSLIAIGSRGSLLR